MYKQIFFPTIQDEPKKKSGLSFTAVIAIVCFLVLAGIFIYKMNQDNDDDDNIVGPASMIPSVAEALII